jgi:predicted transcriptional regulator YdeE
MKRYGLMLAVVAIAALVAGGAAQTPVRKPASPPGMAATQIGGKYVEVQGRQRYQDGKWIEVTYGRPIKRGRQNLFGMGADYGKAVSDGAPVWRAGANQTTRLKTEVPLVFDGKTLPAGEYSVFVELKENAWTLIFSSWPAQDKYDQNNKDALWGAYGYTPDKDVVRAAMKVETLPFSMDQFTIAFIDVTIDGGKLAMMWDKTMATASFKSGS